MKSIVIGLVAFSTTSVFAANPCLKAARAAVSHKFHVSADINQDVKQPSGSGTYELLIWKDECYYEVSVKMKKTSEKACKAEAEPVLDEDSANCG